MKRKLLMALVCALALCWLCGAALGESKTEYGRQIGASLDALQIALASQDKRAANSALAQVRSSVYAAVRYLAQIGEYDNRAMEILSNANQAYTAAFGGDGNYASYMSQARAYNTQFFGDSGYSAIDPDMPFIKHVHRSSELAIIEPATCDSEGLASGICDAGVDWYGIAETAYSLDHGFEKSAPCGAYFTCELEIDPNNHAGGTAIQGQNIVCLGCGAVLSSYTVSIDTDIANGAVALSGESTQFAENATVILTATPAQGYELDSLTYTPAGGAAVVITADASDVYSFLMPAANVTVSATFRQTVYAITTDSAALAYYYNDSFEQVFPSEAREGTALSLMLDDSAVPGAGNYFTGEFTVNGRSLGREYSEDGLTSWPVTGFSMPAEAVTIGAVKAARETLALTFAPGDTRALPMDAWMQLQYYETAVGEPPLLRYDEATGTEALDVNRDGKPDLQIAFDDEAYCVNLTRMPACAAFGAFSFAFSGPTDRYGTVAFTLPAPAFGPAAFTLPAALTTIEESAFEGNIALTVVEAGEGVTAIGADAFKGCANLTQIKLPANCAIDPAAFTGCGTVYVFAPSGGTTEAFCQNPNVDCVFVETQD